MEDVEKGDRQSPLLPVGKPLLVGKPTITTGEYCCSYNQLAQKGDFILPFRFPETPVDVKHPHITDVHVIGGMGHSYTI